MAEYRAWNDPDFRAQRAQDVAEAQKDLTLGTIVTAGIFAILQQYYIAAGLVIGACLLAKRSGQNELKAERILKRANRS